MALRIKENIRLYKPDDPYYYEVDNLPISDLLENCVRLQDQLDELSDDFGDPDDLVASADVNSDHVKQRTFDERK